MLAAGRGSSTSRSRRWQHLQQRSRFSSTRCAPQAAGRTALRGRTAGRRPHSTWGLRSRPGRSTSRSRCGSRPSVPPGGADGSTPGAPQPQAASQHLGAAQQAGAAQHLGAAQQAGAAQHAGASQQAGRSSSSRSMQRPAGMQPLQEAGTAALRARRNRKPPRSTWGPHSRPGAAQHLRGPHSRPGRSSCSLAAGQMGLHPRQQARTAALRSTRLGTTAGRLTSLGGFTALRGFTTARTSKQIGPSTVGGGHDAQSEEGHRRQQKTTLHGSYSL